MAEIRERPTSDRIVRGWATFFELISLGAELYGSTTKTVQGPSQSTRDHVKDGVIVSERVEQVIQVCGSRGCRAISVKEVFRETTGGAVVHYLTPSLGLLGSLKCDVESERCELFQNFEHPTMRAVVPSDPGWQRSLFSFLVDAVPGLGTGKAMVEIVTGEDPVTNQPVSRISAAVSVGASLFPAGKSVVRVVTTSGDYRKFAKTLSQAVRHYTSGNGAKAIAETGVLRTGLRGRDRNLVFVQPPNQTLLEAREAERYYGLHRGRGRNVVEFELPAGVKYVERMNQRTGAKEWTIGHEIELDPKKTVIYLRGTSRAK